MSNRYYNVQSSDLGVPATIISSTAHELTLKRIEAGFDQVQTEVDGLGGFGGQVNQFTVEMMARLMFLSMF